ncbi:MAG: rhodanese-like domain-containing protein [Flaviramulus sp.]|nr:rhodanese-like domain-containing protein [Flaviramulus sp.]NNC50352.1 rhodanese-like domain-containing protein [Flaviramulus sp.]
MKNILILFVIVAFTSCNGQVSKKINTIDLTKLNQDVIGKNVQFVDVRKANEYFEGHIDDAINIDVSNEANFKIAIEKLNKNQPVYIYCYSGGRSNKASKIMEELGFSTIYDFSGGWSTWSKK